jgi:hypothetical protein
MGHCLWHRKDLGRLFNVLVDIKPLSVNRLEFKGFIDRIPAPYGFGVERSPVLDVPNED